MHTDFRERRLRLGLSRVALAEALGVSAATVGRWERASARQVPAKLIALALTQLEGQAATNGAEHTRPAAGLRTDEASRHHNLPGSLTSFVGRQVEREDVRKRLGRTRLVTLVGIGGVGKTRLALEVAGDLVASFSAGVWLVDLAPVVTAELVPHALAAALGIRERPGAPILTHVAETVGSDDLLLVLDNCEHLRAASADLAAHLMAACPRLRILATSREPLGLAGEALFQVPPLSLPEETQDAGGQIESAEAVRLFIERASSVRRGLALTQANTAAVVRVCQRLAGIPLALELAAARLTVVSLEELAQRLQETTNLPRAGDCTPHLRHQTLWATFDWSYGLLSRAERQSFDSMSVFAGGWEAEACERVCLDLGESPALHLLAALVARSLVVAEEQDGVMRFRLLEPLRQYAWDHLEAAGQDEAVRNRHLDYYLALAEAAAPRFWREDQLAWFRRADRELGNFRAALEWSATGDDDRLAKGVRLATALWRFWDVRGYLQEGYGWLRSLLAKAPAPSATRARGLAVAGYLTAMQGDYRTGRLLAEEALTLGRQIREADTLLDLLLLFGLVVGAGGQDPVRTTSIWEELLELGRAIPSAIHIGASVYWLGELARLRGDVGLATHLFEESLEIARDLGNTWSEAYSLSSLAHLALDQKEYRKAGDLYRQGLALRREIDDARGIPLSLEALGWLAAAEGRADRAARLLGAAEALHEAAGASLVAGWAPEHARALSEVHGRLTDPAFARVWAAGRRMSVGEAVAYALAPGAEALPAAGSGPPLTARELEIADLLAGGLSNRLIADRLVISKHTADRHVSHILRKLGVSNRAQVATWVVGRERA